MEKKRKFYLPVEGKLISVTEEVYKGFYKMRRREKYLEERDIAKGLLNFESFDTHNRNFIDYVADETINIEKIVEAGFLIKELHRALNSLTAQEKELIEKIFFQGEMIKDIAREEDVSHVAIQKRRNRILKKLKEILKDFYY